MTHATIDQAMQTALRHHQAGRLTEAQAACRQVLGQKPDHADALHLLGIIAMQLGQVDAGVDLITRAIAGNLNIPEYHYNLGNALAERKDFDQAISAYQNALRLRPDYSDALNNLSNAMVNLGRIDDAIEALVRAQVIRPDDAKIHDNLGRMLKDNGRLDDAIAAFRRAIVLKPDFAEAHSNLVYAVNFHPDFGPAEILSEARTWADRHERRFAAEIVRHANEPVPERRLKIGYISPDFRSHPVGRFLLPLFIHHDPSKVEVFCYSDVKRPDEMTARLKQFAHQWRECAGITDAELARQVREDRIDILVDLALHTAGNRLPVFARKPAPVQVTWLGYAGTTGLSAIDYRITDPYLDPPGSGDEFYSEESIRLPHSFWCHETPPQAPEVNPLPAIGGEPITFGSFNHFTKVSSAALDLWAKILAAIPNSRLVIHIHRQNHQALALARFSENGIDPQRIAFVGLLPLADYFSQYHRIDIALDPFPHGGGATTCDALWMGVPTITLHGQTSVGRGGVSILSHVGLTDWIAGSQEDYLSIAVKMTDGPGKLAELRSTLRQRMLKSPLMNAPQFAGEMESAFRAMWQRWCSRAR
jgi:predicted O-linked N-acetylglucosamine transferase (SPINDLY family)